MFIISGKIEAAAASCGLYTIEVRKFSILERLGDWIRKLNKDLDGYDCLDTKIKEASAIIMKATTEHDARKCQST